MYKTFIDFQGLNFWTFVFVCLIIISVVKANYLKLKTKKNILFLIYLIYAILVIAIGFLANSILLAINEFGKYDNVQVHLAIWLRIIEFLPYILLVLAIYFVKNIHGYKTEKKKISTRAVTSILIIATILVVYYLPHRNIINFPINELIISADSNGLEVRDIDNKEAAEKFLEVINRYTFNRTTYKSTKGLKADDINLQITGSVKERRYVFKVIKYNNNETVLEINYNLYKVKNQEKFEQEIFGSFNLLK